MIDDIVDKPPWPDCMMPDGGDACKYVAWQAAEIERLRNDNRILTKQVMEAAIRGTDKKIDLKEFEGS